MKKALRERTARPADDHSTTVDARNSSSVYSTTSAAAAAASAGQSVTSVSSHNCSSTYPKNTVPGTGSHSVAAVSSDLNLPTLSAQRQSWPHQHAGSQHNVPGGHSDKSAVRLSSSSASLHRTDSSNLIQQPVVSRHFSLRHSAASHTHTPTTNHH